MSGSVRPTGVGLPDAVFKALADPSRRHLLDRLNARNGQNLGELCVGLHMARQSVSKHLAILESAGLVTTLRRGREKLHYLNAEPINEIFERWINPYHRDRVAALGDLKRALEATGVERPGFTYTIYIRTTPAELWTALTDPVLSRRYGNDSFDTDWKVGSTMTLVQGDCVIADPDQVVLEADPFRRLSYTWHSFTSEWAQLHGISENEFAAAAGERRSTVSFHLEPEGELVRLTVVHDDFDPGSRVLTSISQGWPRVLSALKSMLETGE